MNTYLVTGAAGFIGCNFVKHLLARYGNTVQVVVLDALTYAGNLASLASELERGNVHFVRGDVADREVVRGIFARHDVTRVVNFAAESHVDRSITNPRLFLETNILGTQNMLACAREAWQLPDGIYRNGVKYLQISTDEVYGSLSKDWDQPRELQVSAELAQVVGHRADAPKAFGEGFFTEDTPLSPRSPYSASKASADFIVQAYHHTYGLPVNITRCSNNYGPYHFPEKLIPLIINNILQGKKLPVYGQGLNVRDWLYVDDHCKAIDLVLERGRVGEVYNVGGFNEESNIAIVRQVIAIIARIMRDEPAYQRLLTCPLEAVSDDLITYVADRPGHDMRYAIDPTKIATELGWWPETPFAVGIEKTVRWNLDHHDWVQQVASGEYQQYYEQMYNNR